MDDYLSTLHPDERRRLIEASAHIAAALHILIHQSRPDRPTDPATRRPTATDSDPDRCRRVAESPSTEDASPPAGESRATVKQLGAIFAAAKSRGWSNKYVRDLAQQRFGVVPDLLTKKQASAMIDQLRAGAA